MSAKPDNTNGDRELLQTSELPMTADGILRDFTHYFGRMLGRRTIQVDSPFLYQSVVYAARDRLMERWNKTRNAVEAHDNRRVAYLSLEFLMGRLLRNALLNLGIEDETTAALDRIGLDLEDVCDRERDTGLGNGGLGRLAACFLDSLATLEYPAPPLPSRHARTIAFSGDVASSRCTRPVNGKMRPSTMARSVVPTAMPSRSAFSKPR